MDGPAHVTSARQARRRQSVAAVAISALAVIGIVVATGSDGGGRSVSLSTPSSTSVTTVASALTTTSIAGTPPAPVTSSPTTSPPAISVPTIPVATTTIPAATISPTTIPAGSTAPPAGGLPSVTAAAYAVYDASTGTWLAENQADQQRPVGSVMKLLSSYVILQAGDLTKEVTVPQLQVDLSESAIGLYTGEQLPRDVLLRAMLIVSANDAAQTLAIDVGGTTEGFVTMMNAAAVELGLTNTVAANPIGLDADGAHSSARDMITVASVLIQNETFRAAVAKPTASLHKQTFANTNKLLTTYPGADGIKTGHTTGAGYCVVGSATRDGRTLIVAVLGEPSDTARVADASALLDWGFAQP